MIKIDPCEFEFTFSRSQGPGGQNVNKVNTRATMTWNLKESNSIHDGIKERFKKEFSRFVKNGVVTVSSQKFKTQISNKKDCVAKLLSMLEEVRLPPKLRIPTKASKAQKKKRLNDKKKHAEKKSFRREKF